MKTLKKPLRPKTKRTPEELAAVRAEGLQALREKHAQGNNKYARANRTVLKSHVEEPSGEHEVIVPGQPVLHDYNRKETQKILADLEKRGLRDGDRLLIVPNELSDLFKETVSAGLRYALRTFNRADQYIAKYTAPGCKEDPPLLFGKITGGANEMFKALLRAQTATDANALMAAREDDAIAEILRRVKGEG